MISNTIDQEIKQAMLAKDQVRLRGLRAIKAAVLLAKTEKGGTEELSEDVELKLLQKLIKQRKESAEIYAQQGRADLSMVEEEEIGVISQFMPKQLDRAEIEAVVKRIISDTSASSMKDIGKVMPVANKELAGKADGKLIAEVVKAQLA